MPRIWDKMRAMWRHCNEFTNMNPLGSFCIQAKLVVMKISNGELIDTKHLTEDAFIWKGNYSTVIA